MRPLSIGIASLALFLAACSSGGEVSDTTQAPAPTSSSTTTTLAQTLPSSTTTTTRPLTDRFEAHRQQLSRAVVEIDLTIELPRGTITGQGYGEVHGGDSYTSLLYDASGLDTLLVDSDGTLIGRGGSDWSSRDDLVYDGELYRAINDLFVADRTDDPATMVGEVMAGVSAAVEWTATSAPNTLVPVEAIDYRTSLFGPPGIVPDALDAETKLAVDPEGRPIRVTIEATSPDVTLRADIRITAEAPTPFAEPPAWVRLSDLGYQIADGVDGGFDMVVPAGSQVLENNGGMIILDTPFGPRVSVFVEVPGEFTFDDVYDAIEIALITDGEPIEPTSARSDGRVLPTRRSTFVIPGHSDMSQLYAEEWAPLVFVVYWNGPNSDIEFQEELFDHMIRSITHPPVGDDHLIPGNTKGDLSLQADAWSVVGQAIRTLEGCDNPSVVWSEITASSRSSWTESWYIDVCGEIQIHPITFADSSIGGIDIVYVPTDAVEA